MSVSPSTSVAETELVSGVSSAVASLLSFATGASLTELTVTVTVARLDCSMPSVARYVKVSVPWKFAAGA